MTRIVPLLLLLCLLAPTTHAADARQRLQQAEQALANGDDRRAEKLISRIPSQSLDAIALARLQMLRAELALKRNKPRGALHALPRTSEHVPSLAPQIELLRGRAWFMEGQPVYAVRVLTQREYILKSPEAIEHNRKVIWEGLISAPIPASTLREIDQETTMTRGWIDLALVMQDGVTPAALQHWNNRHSGHPAARLARGLGGGAPTAEPQAAPDPTTVDHPTSTASAGGFALLLPITGELALAGQAVRDGFIAAWFESRTSRSPIKVYDTGGDPRRSLAALSEAQRDGAAVIIGPLDRPSIRAIAREQRPFQPWLALNYVDDLPSPPLQFGLAPQDEAHAAARDAIAQGLRKALVLAPANSWGNRAVDAFREVFELEGGTVLATERHPVERRDLTRSLQTLLGVDASKRRHQELDQILGSRTGFEPSTRQDADLLYAPLRAGQAHTLRLKLKFLDAPAMPIYLLSAAHQGHLNPQLGGLRICDMPWVLQSTGHWIARRERAARDFPDLMRSQPRLFALGSDAYRLGQQLEQRSFDPRPLDSATGQLRLVGRRVERGVGCHTLPEPEPEFDEAALEASPETESEAAGDPG